MNPVREGHTLIELLVATGLALLVLVAGSIVQRHGALAIDTGQRKMTAAAATNSACLRLRERLVGASRVWVVPSAAREVLGSKAAVLYADATEIAFDPKLGTLSVDGEPIVGLRLSSVAFETAGSSLHVVMKADESAPRGPARPEAAREQSVLATRLFLQPQADAERYAAFPEQGHDWCLGAAWLHHGVVEPR